MKKLVIIILTISCIQLLFSCSKNFNVENWEGAVFVSPTNSYRGNVFPFTGEWYLYEYEDTKSLIISYDKRQTSFAVIPFDIDIDFNPHGVTLRSYVGAPDDMVYHVLIEESSQQK